MYQTLINIKKVSLVFFILTGLIHLGSTALISNSIYLKQAFILNRTMDIPVVLTGLIYAFSSMRLSLTDPNKKHKVLDISLISIIMLVLAGLLYINLAIPNLT